ncbi:MAG: cation-translocating P-type ATPase, partial [Eubacteriales bacterium]|nr:cation-translocating P-type ATPase [Eubacteriales bacterium]
MKTWHEKGASQVLEELQVDVKRGLSDEDVIKKREQYGENKFAEFKKEGLLTKILHQLTDVSQLILIFAVILSLGLAIRDGHGFIEPIVIGGIVIMNIILAITQEKSAEKAMEALANMSSPTCLVIRNGMQQQIMTVDVVPGDIIVLKAGNLIPSDARLISTNNLQIDESSLTGESEPAEKDASLVLEGKAPLGDQKNMVFSSCLVTGGKGLAVATSTGMSTQMGKISALLQQDKKTRTPLQNRLNRVGGTISFIAILSAVILLVVGIMQGEDLWSMLLLAVALAVAAVPETLNLIVTLTLTHGVKNMAEKHALIRKLQAVETLGSTSIICSDKTGTLTQNIMTIKRLWIYGEEPIKETDELSEEQNWFLEKLLIACNTTIERKDDGEIRILGDSTEAAITRLALDKGIDIDAFRKRYPKVAEIPFSSSRKMMTVVIKNPRGSGYLVITKGAFDRIPYIIKNNDQRLELQDVHNKMAADAMRIITLASKVVDELPGKSELEKLEADLSFDGLIGIIDPPRPEAIESIRNARRAGIRTIMITGDHAATAAAIARELGIIVAKEGVITGPELTELSDEELAESIEFYSVYARVSPEDKLRIVEAWQSREEVVAMTGDGVNDSPALRSADVGIAMGINGTDVAKGASDMILTDDNFATIMDAVTEGRNVFANIRRTIYFLIVCNISEIVIILGSQLMGWAMPVTPMMLILINVVGDGIPGLALAREKSDPRIMNRRPIGRNESFFGGGLIEVIIQQVIAFAAVTWVGYYIGFYVVVSDTIAPSYAVAQTMVFLILGFTSVLHVFTVKSRKSIFRMTFRDNPRLIINVVIVFAIFVTLTAVPIIGATLGFAPM